MIAQLNDPAYKENMYMLTRDNSYVFLKNAIQKKVGNDYTIDLYHDEHSQNPPSRTIKNIKNIIITKKNTAHILNIMYYDQKLIGQRIDTSGLITGSKILKYSAESCDIERKDGQTDWQSIYTQIDQFLTKPTNQLYIYNEMYSYTRGVSTPKNLDVPICETGQIIDTGGIYGSEYCNFGKLLQLFGEKEYSPRIFTNLKPDSIISECYDNNNLQFYNLRDYYDDYFKTL
jgi:hypothetical protein